MYKRIVVPLDGSDLAEHALPTGEELARLTGAPLHLLRVVNYPISEFSYASGSMIESSAMSMRMDDERVLAETYLNEVTGTLAKQGLSVTKEVRYGVAVQELVDAMHPGDLFVIASHGRSGVARWFLGSVAEEITRRSTVPVLLIRSTTAGSRQQVHNASAVTA